MTRLPLQTGASSRAAWVAALLGLPALLVLGWGVALAVVDHATTGLVLSALGVALMLVAGASVSTAVGRRASDLLVDEGGLRVDGGPHHGLRLPWSELGAGAVRAVDRDGSGTAFVLRTATRGALTLAETRDAEEGQSLRNLAGALESARPGASPTGPAPPPEAPTCSACGAPVPPTAEPTVQCRHCGHTVATSESVRERMQGYREHADAAQASRTLVAELLAQPSAATANARMAIVFVLAAWLVLAFVAGEVFLVVIGVAEATTLGVSAVFALLLVFLVSVMTARRFVDRHALQSLLAVFGAHPPRRSGEPWGCRACGAPLPDDGAALVRCVFCQGDNVTGVNLRPAAAKLAREATRLEQVLDRRRSKRRWGIFWFWVLAPGAVLCGLVAAFFVALGLEFLGERDRCSKGEARACVSLAFTYSDEANLRRDLAKAARLAERGCVLGDDTGCCIARRAREERWGDFSDEGALQRRLAERASVLDAECW